MSKAPDNASGAGMETIAWSTEDGRFLRQNRSAVSSHELVRRTDASRLLAQKDAELQRLREALEDMTKWVAAFARDVSSADYKIVMESPRMLNALALLNPKD